MKKIRINKGSLKAGLSGSPTAEQWAYIAGIFDGEGSLTYHNTQNAVSNRRVDIAQKDVTLLYWLESVLGGGVVRRRKEQDSHGADDFRIVRQRQVYEFLMGVLPYVIVKREKVVVAIAELDGRYHFAVSPFETVSE
jgi:hypothetical protein